MRCSKLEISTEPDVDQTHSFGLGVDYYSPISHALWRFSDRSSLGAENGWGLNTNSEQKKLAKYIIIVDGRGRGGKERVGMGARWEGVERGGQGWGGEGLQTQNGLAYNATY